MKFLSLVITIIFLIMQINGSINWPWYAIISPILVLLGIKLLICLIAIIALVIVCIGSISNNKK